MNQIKNKLDYNIMDKFMSVQDVAEALGLCNQSVRRYIHDGRLEAIALTKKNFRITRDAFDDFCRQNKVVPCNPAEIEILKKTGAL